jgi:hypothetical protein
VSDHTHGCDIVYLGRKFKASPIYAPVAKAYRPSSTTVAVETTSGLKVLLRRTGGTKYDYVDEWQYIPEVDEENRPGKYYQYNLRCKNSAPTNYKDKDPVTGRYKWMRLRSHKID